MKDFGDFMYLLVFRNGLITEMGGIGHGVRLIGPARIIQVETRAAAKRSMACTQTGQSKRRDKGSGQDRQRRCRGKPGKF
jgi:hypothetical protein